MKKEFVNLGNPFLLDSTDLIQLGTQDVLDMDVVCTVRNIKGLATKQRQDFKQEQILSQVKSLDDPIEKNKLPLFKSKNTKGQSSRQTESKELKSIFLKSHIRLFSQMYISNQARGGDMDQLFSHETLKYPPAITMCGEMHLGEKSDSLDF